MPIAVLAAVIWIAAPLRAACTLPPELQVQMNLLTGTPAFVQYSRGLEHYDYGCFDEAETELKAAAASLAGPALSLREEELLGLTNAALTLVYAAQSSRRGEKTAAIAQFVEVVNTADSLVKLRAITALVPLLDAKSPHWPLVEGEIDVLARRGYWQAENVVLQGRIGTGNAAAAASHLEDRLRQAENVHDAFAAAILLAHAWLAAGRTLEAWLLIRNIERDAGTDLVDIELRVEFLRVAAAVAGARAAMNDADAQQAKSVYDAALREVQR
ncbi:MAG: hypothetical protein JO197_01625 [Acidobacteria bacterium]|nr:hypothetical protein [Acidobacteriota bacterium]